MKTKKTLFLKKVTISNLSQKDMNYLRGGSGDPNCISIPICGGSRDNEGGFCPDPLTISLCNTMCAVE